MLSESIHTISMACSTYTHQEDQGLFFLIQISLQTSGFIHVSLYSGLLISGQAFNLKLLLKKETRKKLQQVQDCLASLLLICLLWKHIPHDTHWSPFCGQTSDFFFNIYSLWMEATEQGRKILLLMEWEVSFIVMDANKSHLKCKLP